MDKKCYIKIYKHKKIKVHDKVMDILHLEDIVSSVEKEDEYLITSGKYNGKYVKGFNKEAMGEDFLATPLTLVEKNLMSNSNITDESSFTVKNLLSKAKYSEYISLAILGDIISVAEITDEESINAYKNGATPSVSNTLENLINASKVSGSHGFTIDPTTVSQMLGNEDALTLQVPEAHIRTFKDYNIEDKYFALKKKIVGLDSELKQILANITKNISLSYSGMDKDKISALKSTILLIGYPGTGKTSIIKNIADMYTVPTIIEDASRFTPPAYQGADIEDVFVNLYYSCGEDKEAFEHSIIFFDEFDKMCKFSNDKDREIKEDTQDQLLTILSGTIIHKKVREGLGEKTLHLDTSKMTFIFSGAFEEIIDKSEITTEDLVKYGMIRQLASRISTTIKTNLPTKDNLKDALTQSETSYLKLLEEYLRIFNIKIEIDDEFIDYIVEEASKREIGYRGLSAALTEYLEPLLYDVYAGKTNCIKLCLK